MAGVDAALRSVAELDKRTVADVTYHVEVSKNLLRQLGKTMQLEQAPSTPNSGSLSAPATMSAALPPAPTVMGTNTIPNRVVPLLPSYRNHAARVINDHNSFHNNSSSTVGGRTVPKPYVSHNNDHSNCNYAHDRPMGHDAGCKQEESRRYAYHNSSGYHHNDHYRQQGSLAHSQTMPVQHGYNRRGRAAAVPAPRTVASMGYGMGQNSYLHDGHDCHNEMASMGQYRSERTLNYLNRNSQAPQLQPQQRWQLQQQQGYCVGNSNDYGVDHRHDYGYGSNHPCNVNYQTNSYRNSTTVGYAEQLGLSRSYPFSEAEVPSLLSTGRRSTLSDELDTPRSLLSCESVVERRNASCLGLTSNSNTDSYANSFTNSVGSSKVFGCQQDPLSGFPSLRDGYSSSSELTNSPELSPHFGDSFLHDTGLFDNTIALSASFLDDTEHTSKENLASSFSLFNFNAAGPHSYNPSRRVQNHSF